MADEIQDQRNQFNNNLKTLNRNLYKLNKNLKEQTMAYARNKAGAISMNELGRPSASKNFGNISAYNVNGNDRSINSLNKTAVKLDSTTKALEKSTSEFTSGVSDLTESMDNLTSVTEKSNSHMKEFMLNVGKWTAMIAAPALGYAAYRGIRGAGRLGMKTAAIPFKGAAAASRGMGNLTTGFSQEVLGDVGIMNTLKKSLGATMMLGSPLGMAGGMASQAVVSKGMQTTGKAIGSTAEGIGKLVEFFVGAGKNVGKGVYNTGKSIFNVGPSEEFRNEFRNVSDSVNITNRTLQGIQDGDKALFVSPSDEFTQMVEDTSISNKKYRKMFVETFADAIVGKGKGNFFTNTLGNFFGKNVALAYALPIYGAGYRAELPTPGKYGFLGAMLKTLGMIYVHSRFASKEVNDLLMEQSRLLQIGFEIPGTLYKPKARSLSAWLGQSISESLSEVMGGEGRTPFAYMKDFFTGKSKELFSRMGESVSSALGFGKTGKPKTGEERGLAGFMNKMMPGYEDWKKKKSKELQAAELGMSPTSLKRLELLTEIRDILAGLTGAKVKGLKKGKRKIPKLADAMNEPRVVEKAGLSWLDPGEMVGKVAAFGGKAKEFISNKSKAAGGYLTSKQQEYNKIEEGGGQLGFFGKMFKGVMNFFTGGIVNKIVEFFRLVKNAIVALPMNIYEALKELLVGTEGLDGEEKKIGIIGSIKQSISDLKKTFETGGLKAVGKKTGTGILDFINNLPEAIKKLQERTTKSLTEMFNKELGDHATSLVDVAKKTWEELIPGVLKDAITKSYNTFWDIVGKGAASPTKLLKAAVETMNMFIDFGKTVLTPMTDVWSDEMKIANEIVEGKDKSFMGKIVATISAIPDSMKAAWEGLIDTIKKVGGELLGLLDPLFNLTTVTNLESIKGMIELQTMAEWKNVRREGIKAVFPEVWSNIVNTTMDRIWDFGMLGLRIFMKMFSAPGVATKAFKDKISEAAESGTGPIGQIIKGGMAFIKGLLGELFAPVKKFLRKSFRSLIFVGNQLGELTKGGKTSKFANVIDNFWKNIVELKDNLIKLVGYIKTAVTNIGEFVAPTEPKTKMAKGGLIYAAKGVVVGEAGPEAVIPLEHPTAIEKISNIFRAALWGGERSEESLGDAVINRLDTIIGLLSGSGFGTKPGILSQILGGIISMPMKIVGGIFRGFFEGTAKGAGRMVGGFFTLVPKVLEQISNAVTFGIDIMHTGFKTLRGAIEVGFNTMGQAVKTMGKGLRMAIDGMKVVVVKSFNFITAPFKKLWGFITSPFKAMGEKLRGTWDKLTHPVKAIGEAITRKIWGEDVVNVGPDGKPVYARWPKKIITGITGVQDLLYDLISDQQIIGLKVIGLLSKINSKTVVDPELEDKMEPMETLPSFPRKKRRTKAGKVLNLRKEKKPTPRGLLGSIFDKAKDWFNNSSFGQWFSNSALPSMISLMGPALAVLGAGAVGVAIGSMLNKYVVQPMLDKWFNKKDKEQSAAATGLASAQKTRFSALDVYRQTGKGKEQAMASAFAAKATRGFIGASGTSARRGEILGDTFVSGGGDISSGQVRNLGVVRDAQLKYMADNANRYMKYGPEQVAIMREKWQDRWNGGFRSKRPFVESWYDYGLKREEAFLKYLEKEGKALSLKDIEKQAFAGVKGLPPSPVETFARGGIITKPTLALMGEAGPEAVVPLRESAMGKLAPLDRIADHSVMLDLFRERAGAKEVTETNKKIGEKLDKLSRMTYANTSVMNSFVTNNNNTNVSSVNTNQGATLDEDTEKLLGGKL